MLEYPLEISSGISRMLGAHMAGHISITDVISWCALRNGNDEVVLISPRYWHLGAVALTHWSASLDTCASELELNHSPTRFGKRFQDLLVSGGHMLMMGMLLAARTRTSPAVVVIL